MTGTRFTLVGVLAVAIAVHAVGQQEGGFQVPLNNDPVIPVPTGDPGFYANPEFLLGRSRAVSLPPPPPDLSRGTAGGFRPYCERALPPRTTEAPLRPAQQLYRQLLILSEPFRAIAEESSAQDTLRDSAMMH
jgi:hypothetical protein